MDNSLTHHGILGQKWGIRRFQNKDGSLTAAGRRRLYNQQISYDNNGNVNKDDKNRARGAIHQTVATDYRNLSSGLQSAKSITNTVSNMEKQAGDRKRSKEANSFDLSKMTDKDLREAVNRLNMEKQYRMLKTENISTGNDYISEVLSTAGDVLAVGASLASIAVAIHTIRS